MQRPRQPADPSERLVYFTDAVVAISLTLLVLPLVDLVPEARRESPYLGHLLRGHLPELGAFVLSFAVVSGFWWAHHRLFRHVSRLNGWLVLWSGVWMFSIVFLPVPTAIITAYAASSGTVVLYIGTLVVTSGSLTMMAVAAYRDPRLSADRRPVTRDELLGLSSAFGLQVVALVVGTVFAARVNYGALLLMFLSGPIERVVKRYWVSHPGRARSTGTGQS